MNNKQQKSNIRKQIRLKRQNLSLPDNIELGTLLIQQLEKHNLLSPYQNIACFLSFDGEIATDKVIQSIWHSNKTCYLPKLVQKTATTANSLQFLPYYPSAKMTDNHYGIPEVDDQQPIKIATLDLVLFPLVAFDSAGNRLGMGGGFYDATFAPFRNMKNRPKFVGLAHDFQQVDNLPKESWDLPLDGVCTPSQYLRPYK